MKGKGYQTAAAVLAMAALVASALRPERSGCKGTTPHLPVHSASLATNPAGLVQAYGKLPLNFEPNQGQADRRIRFLTRGSSYNLFLTADSAILTLRGSDLNEREHVAEDDAEFQDPQRLTRLADIQFPGSIARISSNDDGAQTKDTVLWMTAVDANPNARLDGLDQLSGKSNYFVGTDPKEWHTNIPNYAEVKYTNVYPGVDLVYHGNQGRLEYDFVVQPGADPREIRLAVESPASKSSGKSELRIDRCGDLLVSTMGGEVRFHRPVSYQPTISNREPANHEWTRITDRHFVDSKYDLRGNRVMFKVATYDKSKPLVIDPTLVYSTFLGGSRWDHGNGIAVDSSGNAYVTGNTFGANFPVTAGAYNTKYTDPGYSDVFVAKLNAAGSALVYSTYLGGSGNEEGDSIAIEPSGNAFVTGWTASTNFPITAGAYQTNKRGGYDDGFVTKLNSTGSALVYSTYLGGSSFDEAHGIAIDSSGHAYVTGLSYSDNFPTTPGAAQTTLGGLDDAFVSELNAAGSALVYSTYLGGSSYDDGRGIAVDALGDAYVVGFTYSANFPTTIRAFQTTLGGGYDSFVTKLNPGGSAMRYSTYLGGANDDFGYGIAVDASGSTYLTGLSYSANFPTTAGALQTTLRGGSGTGHDDAFVTKLNAAGSALVYSTYVGGSGDDVGYGIAVDASGNALVTGATYSFDFPTTAGAHQTTPGGFDDGFFSKLNLAGSALGYSTYLAGNEWDEGRGISADSWGNAYIIGWTDSPNFPVTTGAFQTLLGGQHDAFIVKISAK